MIELSIITTCYNAEDTIRRTLESIQAQKNDSIEYIVIDAASKDNTASILDEYKEIIDVFISEPDKGIYDGMNKGISKAKGKYIAILNADDYYTEGALDYILETLKLNPHVDIMHAGIHWTRKGVKVRTVKGRNIPMSISTFSMPALHPTCIVKKSVYDNIGVFTMKYQISADRDFLFRAYDADYVFKWFDRVTVNMESDGASSSQFTTSLFNKIDLAKRRKEPFFGYIKYFLTLPKVYLRLWLLEFKLFQNIRNRYHKNKG